MKRLVLVLSCLMSSAAVAQDGQSVVLDDELIVGTINDDAQIAIPAFATDQAVATAAEGGNTEVLGRNVARVVFADLKNNGLFKPSGPGGLPQPSLTQVQMPDYPTWGGMGADMLVQGYVKAAPRSEERRVGKECRL